MQWRRPSYWCCHTRTFGGMENIIFNMEIKKRYTLVSLPVVYTEQIMENLGRAKHRDINITIAYTSRCLRMGAFLLLDVTSG